MKYLNYKISSCFLNYKCHFLELKLFTEIFKTAILRSIYIEHKSENLKFKE